MRRPLRRLELGVLRDARFVTRHLVRSPGYAIASILTLACAIGANTAIFSAVYGVLLKPLPIRDPAGLVVAWRTEPGGTCRLWRADGKVCAYESREDVGRGMIPFRASVPRARKPARRATIAAANSSAPTRRQGR